MNYRIITFIAILALLCLAEAGQKKTTAPIYEYHTPVSLVGTITREYDMAFVDSDLSPMTDPEKVNRAVVEAQRKWPDDKTGTRVPSPHLILHLEQPIALREPLNRNESGLEPAEKNVTEIDLGAESKMAVAEKDLGKVKFVVTGKLWHGNTVHHLRAVMMEVSGVGLAGK